MIRAAFLAVQDALSPEFRRVLWKALGLTILLFVGVLVAIEVTLSILVAFPWPWLETILAVATGLGVFAAFFFLIAPVTALFAGLFLDDIAALVEARDYGSDPPGKPMATSLAVWTGIQFGLLVLVVNLLLLPTLFLGIGAVMMVIGNAYLLGREYFSMIAMRHMPAYEAHALRKDNAGRVFAAGLIPALLAPVPIINLFVPLFATSYFVHIYKQVRADAVAVQ
jgi:CysZ protein